METTKTPEDRVLSIVKRYAPEANMRVSRMVGRGEYEVDFSRVENEMNLSALVKDLADESSATLSTVHSGPITIWRVRDEIWTLFGDLTPRFTVTAPADGDSAGEYWRKKRGVEGAFFFVSETPVVYMKELLEFCKRFGVYATVFFEADNTVDAIVFHEEPPADPEPDYSLYGPTIDHLLSQLPTAPKQLKQTLLAVAANLGAQAGSLSLMARTLDYYLVVPVKKISTTQLNAMFTATDLAEATAYPQMWTGVSFRVNAAGIGGSVGVVGGSGAESGGGAPVRDADKGTQLKAKHEPSREPRYDPYARKPRAKIAIATTFKDVASAILKGKA